MSYLFILVLPCPEDYLRCNDGQCYRRQYACDGWGYCDDRSDENPDMCKGISALVK